MAQEVRRSYTFFVRTWIERRSNDQYELRGMVRDIQSGETQYFRSWNDLVAFVDAQAKPNERSDNPP